MSGSLLLVNDAIRELEEKKRSLRCNEVSTILISLGFEVRDGNQGGHKVFVHDGLNDFHSGSFNCGHGRNPEIKPAYIGKIIRLLREHKVSLSNLLDK
jgi:hypothetical protein